MTFYIQNIDSGLVLDVKNEKLDDGTEVILYKYQNQNNQHWRYQNGLIHSQLNGSVLDVSGKTGLLIIFKAHGGSNQQWTFNADDTISSGNGNVLDVKGGNAKEGKNLLTYKKHGKPSQRWKRVYIQTPLGF